ncbi:hypothetical protein E2L06_09525 [Haloterrigena sp. H1]|uniref:DUF6735 family protein n=1 Tax=Haloterrigena sp. H1 TaxID=2552943 RepID=UPI00110EDD69|nr:DUF6735 family protein [Haloterrigena sp. H1]TMT86826.1 hypothetical protein E2L06_09525 [Haloterrigena sp. H1]
MGHRALVAYRRPDRLYELRYSHWGGDDLSLTDEISAATPLAAGAIAPSLVTDSITRERILTDQLDPRVYEALYLVDPAADYAVDAYRVCWLEWGDGRDGGERSVGSRATSDPIADGSRGAIVAVDPADDRALRIWFRAIKTALADVVELGGLSRRAARAYLEARVCEEYDSTVYTYGDSLDDDRGDRDEPAPDCWLEDDDRRGDRQN